MKQAPQIIGGTYEVCGTLGFGRFKIVYLAYKPAARQVCALATFRGETAEVRRVFKREASLLLNLPQHPFIRTAREAVEEEGRLFLAMDYVSPDEQGRKDLYDYIKAQNGPLESDTALKWAIQFCFGMEHASTHGVRFHRDIKPTNILITRDGTLKITDFGRWKRLPKSEPDVHRKLSHLVAKNSVLERLVQSPL